MNKHELFFAAVRELDELLSKYDKIPKLHFFLNHKIKICLKKVLISHKLPYDLSLSVGMIRKKDVLGEIILYPRIKFIKIYIDSRKILKYAKNISDWRWYLSRKLSLTFVHEMVHYMQYSKGFSYYKMPYKPSFIDIDDGDDDFVRYLKQHIEIEAWAVETACDLSVLGNPIQMIQMSSTKLCEISSLYSSYYERKNVLGDKIFKKYIKHVCKHLQNIRDFKTSC